MDSETVANEDDPQESVFFLKHQNKAFSTEMLGYKRTIEDLENRLKSTQRRQRSYDATLSVVRRAWDQLESDLRTAAAAIPSAASIRSTAPSSGPASGDSSNATLLQQLLNSQGVLPILDPSDPKAARMNGVKPPVRTEADEPDPLVRSGDVVSSDEEGGTDEPDAATVDEGLRRKAHFTAEMLGSIISGLQSAASSGGASTALSLRELHAELMGQKRKLEGEVLLLRDQLTVAQQKCQALGRDLRAARRDRHRSLRKLEHLAATGVKIPGDNKGTHSAGGASTPGGRLRGPGTPTAGPGDDARAAAMLAEATTRLSMVPNGNALHLASPALRPPPLSGSGSPIDGDAMEVEAAKAEAAELAALRLTEIEAVRKEKIELENEITRLSIKTPSAAGGADGSLASDPEYVKLTAQLRLETEAAEREKARAEELERSLTEARQLVRRMEVCHPKELEAQREKWSFRIGETQNVFSKVQQSHDEYRTKLERTTEELKAVEHLRVRLDEYKALKHTAEAIAEQSKKETERALNRAKTAEENLKTLRAAIPKSDDEAQKAQLSILEAERLQNEKTFESLYGEIETTGRELETVKEQNARTLAKESNMDVANQRLMSEIFRLKNLLELHHQKEGSFTLQVNHYQDLKVQTENYLKQSKEQLDRAEQTVEEMKNQRAKDCAALHNERDRADRAKVAEETVTASLKDLQSQHTLLLARCDELAQRAEACAAAEARAREAAATAQRRAERAKQSNGRLQAKLLGSGMGGDGGGLSSEDGVMLLNLQDEVQELRKVMRCSVCSSRQKDCVITKCFHMFCRECVEENLRTRHRKCPACGKGFGQDDYHTIWLT